MAWIWLTGRCIPEQCVLDLNVLSGILDPWTVLPLGDEFLSQRVPWTLRPYKMTRPWTICPDSRPDDAGLMCPRPMCPRPKILGCCAPWTKPPLEIVSLTDVSRVPTLDRITHGSHKAGSTAAIRLPIGYRRKWPDLSQHKVGTHNNHITHGPHHAWTTQRMDVASAKLG